MECALNGAFAGFGLLGFGTKSILLARGAGDASGKRRFGPSAEAGSARGRARASTSRRPPRRGAALPDAEDARARMATEREESESFILRRKHAH